MVRVPGVPRTDLSSLSLQPGSITRDGELVNQVIYFVLHSSRSMSTSLATLESHNSPVCRYFCLHCRGWP